MTPIAICALHLSDGAGPTREALTLLPSPRLRGEGGEPRSGEPGEGALRYAQDTKARLTRPPPIRSEVGLSPRAGRSDREAAP